MNTSHNSRPRVGSRPFDYGVGTIRFRVTVSSTLVSSDGAVGVGEVALEMGEDLGLCRASRRNGRQLGRRASAGQCGANFTLVLVEAFPDALQRTITELATGGADGSGNAAGDGTFEESPQTTGRQAEPPDFVDEPDADGSAATAASITVAAKVTTGADSSVGTGLVIAAQRAVPNEHADHLAMRARRLFETLTNRVAFLGIAAKPSFLHARPKPPQKSRLYRRERVRGRSRVRSKIRRAG